MIFCIAEGIVLLHAFIKKTQKTPATDLKLAQTRQKETMKRKAASRNKHIGSSFEDFLNEEGIRGEAASQAIKRVLAWQIAQGMAAQKLSKNQMAKRMKTSRSHLDRLLDPDNDKVQLDTVQRAATALGRKLHVELV